MALFSPFLSRRGRNQRQRKSGRGVSTMTNSLKESAEITRERIRAAADSASERAAHVRETAGERANSAYSNVRERGSRIVDRELGGASCRDRWWQNVWISEGAVVLK